MMANSREDSVFFGLYDEDTEGARPDRLFEVRPQDRDQRHTVEQIVDNTLIVPSLDVLVPQLENQLVEVCRELDTHIPELVIKDFRPGQFICIFLIFSWCLWFCR